MPNKNENYACRVCGLVQLEPPWGGDSLTPSYEICSCCGVEFGYEDISRKSTLQYRKKWLENGATWWDFDEKPKEWILEEQLKNIPLAFK